VKVRILVRNFLKRRYAAAGATRHARLLKIEPRCGEKMGSNPHFGAIWIFLALEKRRMFPRTQHWPLSKTQFVL